MRISYSKCNICIHRGYADEKEVVAIEDDGICLCEKCLKKLPQILNIIDSTTYIQEDVLRYQAICNVMKGTN